MGFAVISECNYCTSEIISGIGTVLQTLRRLATLNKCMEHSEHDAWAVRTYDTPNWTVINTTFPCILLPMLWNIILICLWWTYVEIWILFYECRFFTVIIAFWKGFRFLDKIFVGLNDDNHCSRGCCLNHFEFYFGISGHVFKIGKALVTNMAFQTIKKCVTEILLWDYYVLFKLSIIFTSIRIKPY